MKSFLRTRVGRDFLAVFMALALPILAAAWFGIHSATSALKLQTEMTLRAASNGAEAQLREFLVRLQVQTLSLSGDAKVRNSLESPAGTDGRNIAAIMFSLHDAIPEAHEIFILNADGRVVASSLEANVGTDHARETYFLEGRKSFHPGDIVRAPKGEVTWVMSAPIKDTETKRVLGVLALRLNPQVLSDLTSGRRILAEGADSQAFRNGATGETYIVNQNGLMITESRYIPDAILKVKVDTQPIQKARTEGHEMTGDYLDYRGILVSGASAVLRHRGWVLLTEIDFSQAFTPIKRLRNLLVLMTAGLTVAGVMLTAVWVRGIVHPLRRLEAADLALAAGDEPGAIVSEKELPLNEIGEFVRRRNDRVKVLIERQRELAAEQKRSADTAAELERMSYSIVHDMRAPLRAIVNFGDLLEGDPETQLSAESRGYLSRMRGAATRMDQLITDMLSYSALLRGQLPLQPVDLGKLLSEVIDTYPFLRAHTHEIRIQDNLPLVRGNEAALTQCFSSLLENAIKFTRPSQPLKVTIRAEESEGLARIFVEDEGVGIPAPLLARMYGIFQRGSNDTGGNGIGLAMVRIAVTRMNGRVGVNSEEGKGSQFWIELKLPG